MISGFRGSVAALAFLMPGMPTAPVHAQPVAPIRTPSPAMMSDARAAFDMLDETVRREVQEALIWTGDYLGAIDGTFGPRTFNAIVSHQIRERLPQNGILLKQDIDELIAIAAAERDAVGFALVNDPRTGIRIGIPLGLMERREDPSHGGARWQTPDERVTLDTRIFAPGEAELAGLFERLTGPSSGRQVTYRLLRDDFLVVSGETAGGRFYIRYDLGETGIRGFTLGYDKALAQPYDWLTLAIAGNFTAFPADASSSATLASAPEAPFGTGLLVARDTILTSVSLDTCRALRAADRPVTARKRVGEALLLTAEVAGEPVSALVGALAEENAGVIVLAFTGKGATGKGATGKGASESLAAIPGSISSGSLSAPLQAGSSGAPMFSRSGRIVGIVHNVPNAKDTILGVVPPRNYTFIGAAALTETFTVKGFQQNESQTAGAIAASFGTSLVSVFCDD